MSKPLLSGRLLGLKFMQRAQEKVEKAEAQDAAEERDAEVRRPAAAAAAATAARRRSHCDCFCLPSLAWPPPSVPQAHWVVEGARSRCVVIAEGDPPPCASGAAGRLSFRGFNTDTEQLQADEASKEAASAAAAAEAANPDGKTVTDEAMASSLRRQQKQQQRGGGSGGSGQHDGQQQEQHQHHRKKHGGQQRHGDGGSGKKKRRGREGGDEGGEPLRGKSRQKARYF